VSLRSLLRASAITSTSALRRRSHAAPSARSRRSTCPPGARGLAAEQAKLRGQLEKMGPELERVKQKLSNPSFVNKARARSSSSRSAGKRSWRETLKLQRLLARSAASDCSRGGQPHQYEAAKWRQGASLRRARAARRRHARRKVEPTDLGLSSARDIEGGTEC